MAAVYPAGPSVFWEDLLLLLFLLLLEEEGEVEHGVSHCFVLVEMHTGRSAAAEIAKSWHRLSFCPTPSTASIPWAIPSPSS